MTKKIENLTSFIENPDTIIQFKELNQYRIGSISDNLYYFCKFDNNKIITSHKGNNLCVLSYGENTFKNNYKIFKFKVQMILKIEIMWIVLKFKR